MHKWRRYAGVVVVQVEGIYGCNSGFCIIYVYSKSVFVCMKRLFDLFMCRFGRGKKSMDCCWWRVRGDFWRMYVV